jgi:hypothetical protein
MDSTEKAAPTPRSSVTLEDIQKMMEMVCTYKIDEFEIAGIKMKKSIHDMSAIKPASPSDVSEEDALYYSAQ